MMRQPPTVLILHSAPPGGPARGKAVWRESDAAVLHEVRQVEAALARLGAAHRTVGLPRLADLSGVLASSCEQVVFNLVEGFAGAPADANDVPAFCRAFGKGCTGSDTSCLVLALDKWRSKAALRAAGAPVPPATLVGVGEKVRPGALARGRYIVKPVAADASEGIDASCVVCVPGPALAGAVGRVHRRFRQAALVERFVGDRELNVSLVERGGRVEVLAIAEVDFSAFPRRMPRIVDYAAKWLPGSFGYHHTLGIVPARLTARQARLVRQLALLAWRVMGCRDYARVDFRLDRRGRPFILEVNPNPDVSPDAGFAEALAAAGLPFDDFVRTVVESAWDRASAIASAPLPAGALRRGKQGPVHIRRSEQRDRDTILGFLAGTGFFRPDEMLIAREVLDEALAKGPDGHYQSFVAQEGGRAVGWVCFGPTPCTVGTFDIYWIGVAPGRQGCGVGAALMEHAEGLICACGGRATVVETSGRAVYDSTRRFYGKLGYREAARVRDFYGPGDDKVIYMKTLTSGPPAGS